MSDDAVTALIAHIMREWRSLQPMGAAPPPGVWILLHEPIPAEAAHGIGIATAITDAWYGNAEGVRERKVDSVRRLRANGAAWGGNPYHRWGWVDTARLESEPVYYVEFWWGGRYGYGVQAAVTAAGLVLTSSYLWRA